MSTIKTGTTLTTAYQVVGDTTGAFVVQTGSTPTTAMTIDTSQNFGVGTSSPIVRLDVVSATPGGPLRIAGNEFAGFNAYTPTYTNGFYLGFDGSGGVAMNNRENKYMQFATNNTERMRIDSSGNVGIGTSATGYGDVTVLRQATTSTNATFSLVSGTSGYGRLFFGDTQNAAGEYDGFIQYDQSNRLMQFGTAQTERMRIDSSGNLGIGTTVTNGRLNVYGPSVYQAIYNTDASGNDTHSATIQAYGTYWNKLVLDGSQLIFNAYGAERMRINTNGIVCIGRTAPIISEKLSVSGAVRCDGAVIIDNGGNTLEGGQIDLAAGTSYSGYTKSIDMYGADLRIFGSNNWNVSIFSVGGTANLSVQGAVSKGSGSFKIDHPLPEKTDTHHLVHSFIEGPQADNIYRGKVALVAGRAEVNIDTASGMTEGTFVLLNRDVQCFTSNESDWDAVRGAVAGNVLVIDCQNTNSTATVSWLVIGERQDKHMYDTNWTDENGKVIVEPVKVKPLDSQVEQENQGA